MVRTATKYADHTVSVSATYFSPLGQPNQPQHTDKGTVIIGLGGQNRAEVWFRWQGYGYIESDAGTDWSSFFNAPSRVNSAGGRSWASVCLEGTAFSAKYEFKFTEVYAMPEADATGTATFSAKFVVDNVPLVLFDGSSDGAPFVEAGSSTFTAGLVKAKQPFGELTFWPYAMVKFSTDGSVTSQYAFSVEFNGQIPVGTSPEQIMTYKGGNLYELLTPAFDDADLDTRQRWLYTIEPSDVSPGIAGYDRQKIQLSDADDDALFQNTVSPAWFYPGSSDWGGWSVTPNPFGYLVTVDLNVGGTRKRKFWQFDQDWTRYREIVFNPLDATATAALLPSAETTGFANMDDTGNIVYVPQGGGVFEVLGGPAPSIPDWEGSTGDTQVRAWTFPLDDHDFYVLRLGLQETLVYDAATKQWHPWSSFDNAVWAVNTGFSWQGGTGVAETNIVVGDDTTGDLYWLDPLQPYDEAPAAGANTNFERVASTFFPARGRQAFDCYSLYLSADMEGDPARWVKLETSDDNGVTYTNHGTITVAEALADSEYSWRSLGLITAPGRLFRVTDNGAAQRLDGLEFNDTAEDDDDA